MLKTRNLNPTRKKQSKPLRGHFRDQFKTNLDRILNPKNPYTPELPPTGKRRPAPPRDSDIQPAEGTQNLAVPSPPITENITPSSSGFVQTPWFEASQPPQLGGQLLPSTARDLITLNTSFPVPELIQDHAQGFEFASFDNMLPDNLNDYGRQPYHPTQGTTTSDILDGFTYPNSPPTAAWGAQGQHTAGDSYFTQAPSTTAASAQQPWEQQQPEPQPDLTFRCQSIKIWGPNECWEYLNAVFDDSSQHSYLRSSAAHKAGWSRFIPVAPRHNHQGLTQYGVITPTHYVNTYLEAEGFFEFPLRNEDVYIFPDDHYCPAHVEFIIGRNLWQAVYPEAEASASATTGLGY
ncbi:hypothetical protein BHE90_010045 [Fusarium euwallaceae]|uniref:Uncharacterized protein n=1 Tax=Fusarium euwallaceae TaxID=1147111 RepID=A0A430LIJ8_9HYPO|nr:hypothetical protein BHE90_010045 [Fusarium euwallaceae]